MDPRSAFERAPSSPPDREEPEAVEFVRFCYRRRRVGWPELYDEMCAVAGRGLYRGYSADDLNGIGIGFALFELPALATIVQRVVAEDTERLRARAHAVRASYAAATEAPTPADAGIETPEPTPPTIAATPDRNREATVADVPLRLAALPVGA
jgi:hypothetical protein